MKHFIHILALLLVAGLIFSSCKKDPVDLKNSYMTFQTGEDGVWAGDNQLNFYANMSPGTLSDGKVSVTISSEADPEGYTVELGYYNTTVESGRDVYNVQQTSYIFNAAAYTNADNKAIEVNPEGDNITITLDDGAFSDAVVFQQPYNPLLVVSNRSSSGYATWNIDYYNEDGHKPDIKVYTQSHTDPITVSPDEDLGDGGYLASNPEIINDAFGKTYYSVRMITDEDAALGYGDEVFVNAEDDIVYVEMDGETFSLTYSHDRLFNVPMRKE